MRSSIRPLLRLEAIEIGRVRLRYQAARELRRIAEEKSLGGKNQSLARLSKDGEFDSLLAVAFSHCPKQHSLLEAE